MSTCIWRKNFQLIHCFSIIAFLEKKLKIVCWSCPWFPKAIWFSTVFEMQLLDYIVKFLAEEKDKRNEIDSVCQLHRCHLLVHDLELANFKKSISITSECRLVSDYIKVGAIHVSIHYKYLSVHCEFICRTLGFSVQLISGINVICMLWFNP